MLGFTSFRMDSLYISSLCSTALLGFLVFGTFANETTVQTPDINNVLSESPDYIMPINRTLMRCACQRLEESECLAQELHMSFFDINTQQQFAVSITDFPDVIVNEFQCGPGFMKSELLNNTDFISLLSANELVWFAMNMLILDFCVEPVPGGWAAQVCLELPSVPRCCSPGYVLGPGDECIQSSSSPKFFAPPLKLKNEVIESVKIERGEMQNVTCNGIASERRLNLNRGEGYLLYGHDKSLLTYKGPSYAPYEEFSVEYCVGIDESDGDVPNYIARFCYVDPKKQHHHICRNATCVRKCCDARQFHLNGECAELHEGEKGWEPVFHEKNILKPGAEGPKDLFVVHGLPLCEVSYQLQPEVEGDERSYLLSDGSLYLPDLQTLGPDRYCLDMYENENGDMKELRVICAPETGCKWKPVLYVILLSLSCVFLIATLAVYLGVADLRDRTNGRCLLSMVVAMLAAYISLIVNNQEMNPTKLTCLLTAFFGQVFGLAMFFWLNVMCYDMWATLRSSQHQHQSKKTFIKYSLYAWGIPLLVGTITMIIDQVQPPNVILPNFLEGMQCWFRDDPEYWLYLSGIILVLILVNLFFFIHVAITLARKLQQRQSVFDNSNSRTNNSSKTKKQPWLYVKLFIVMGIVWIADVSSSIKHRNTCSFWVITDIINGLQGVFIFLVAVCNRDNLKKFRNAWNPRVNTIRSKMSTLRGVSPISTKNRRKTADSLATSEASRKTSVTSLPRKISTTSTPLHHLGGLAAGNDSKGNELNVEGSRRSGSSPPYRKISQASNLETIPMNPLEDVAESS